MSRTPKLKTAQVARIYQLRREGYTLTEIGELMRCTAATVRSYCIPESARIRGVPEPLIAQLPSPGDVAAAKIMRKGLAKLRKQADEAAAKISGTAARHKPAGLRAKGGRLTLDELELLYRLRAEGVGNGRIARELDITPGEVRLHLHPETAAQLGVPPSMIAKHLSPGDSSKP